MQDRAAKDFSMKWQSRRFHSAIVIGSRAPKDCGQPGGDLRFTGAFWHCRMSEDSWATAAQCAWAADVEKEDLLAAA
jgi:hypothetical protein